MDMQAKIQKGGTLDGQQRPARAARAREDARREAASPRRLRHWRGERGDEDRFGYRLPGGPGQLGAEETRVTLMPATSGPEETHRDEHRDRPHADDPMPPTLATLARVCGDGVFATSRFRDNLRLFVPPSRLLRAADGLKKRVRLRHARRAGRRPITSAIPAGPGPGSRSITCCGTSRPRERLVVKAGVDDPDPTLPSAVPLWPGADWMEREVFDMYRHPLRRPSRPAAHPDARGVHRLPAPQGLSAPRPRRTPQLPAAHARRILTRRHRSDLSHSQDTAYDRRTRTRDAMSAQLARRTGARDPDRRQAGHLDAQLRPAAPRHPHDAAPDPRARRRADRQGDARHRLPALRVREARRAPQLQPVRDDRRPEELHQPADERGGLAPRRREAAGHRADAALPVHPRDHLASWRGSATTCSAPAPRRSTSGRSPRSCTPSTCGS